MDSVLREKWFGLSLVQQMVNIGNEVKRGLKFYSEPEKRNMFFEKAIQYTQLTMEDCKNAHVLPELLISKKVLEDYFGEHKLACTEEQINRYYQAYQYLLRRSCAATSRQQKIGKLDTPQQADGVSLYARANAAQGQLC